jgi:site-specific recombinase XerD
MRTLLDDKEMQDVDRGSRALTTVLQGRQPPPAAAPFGPVHIDWEYLLHRRPIVLKHCPTLPAYLLLPEIRNFHSTIEDLTSQVLFETLWRTGARISEALALTRDSFDLDPRSAYVSLESLKRRGRPRRGKRTKPLRMVPVRDDRFIHLLKTYFASARLRARGRLFPFTRQAADARLRTLLKRYAAAGRSPSIATSSHTYRHSFAVNCVLQGTPVNILQGWMGHADIESTAIYTQVLNAETGHLMARIEF